MRRIDNLSQNRLTDTVRRVGTGMQEIKNQQRFGSSSAVMYRVFSPDTWDITVNDVGSYNKIVEVVFTPDDPTANLGGVLRMEYKGGGTAGADPIVEALTPSGGISKWRLYLQGSDASPWTQRFKFYFFTNANGTFSASLI